MLVANKAEVTRLNLLKPLGLKLAILGERRHPVRDSELRRRIWLALQLLLKHVDMVLVDVSVADEVRKPPRLVACEPCEQVEEGRAFSEVEGRAKAHVI